MSFTFILLDFENSSLGDDSYPIAVGGALALNPDEPIRAWSSLIKPDRNWALRPDWDPAAETVHHIPAALIARELFPKGRDRTQIRALGQLTLLPIELYKQRIGGRKGRERSE